MDTIESEIPVNRETKSGLFRFQIIRFLTEIEISINPEKAETFTISFRIPEWSEKTIMTINGKDAGEITAGTYKKITRVWNKYDKVVLKMDLTGRLVKLNGCQAILRGPIVLARDTRFGDGFIYESAVVKDTERESRI